MDHEPALTLTGWRAWCRCLAAGLGLALSLVASAAAPDPAGLDEASGAVRQLLGWVRTTGDHHHLPFIIVDKVQARVYVFRKDGELAASAAALIGLAVGDESVPGIGDRKLSSIRPFERTTPAGRFDASLGRNLHGADILWLDYDGALSLHRVVAGTLKERRAQRLASAVPADRRISFGCINVPVRFYEQFVRPAFAETRGVVYVLPEVRSLQSVFGADLSIARSPDAQALR